jgi:hypothetical protein
MFQLRYRGGRQTKRDFSYDLRTTLYLFMLINLDREEPYFSSKAIHTRIVLCIRADTVYIIHAI